MNKTVNKNLIRQDEGKQKVTVAYQRRRANRCPDKHSRLAKAMENIVRLVYGKYSEVKGISEKEISIGKPQKKKFCKIQYLFDYSVYKL